MEELMAKLQGVLSTPEGMQQLSNIQQLLSGNNTQTAAPVQPPAVVQAQPSGLDMSALSSMLGGLMNSSSQSNTTQGSSSGLDMSALSSMLGGLMNSSSQSDTTQGSSSGLDMSALSSMLGGLMNSSSQSNTTQGSSSGLDMSALSSMLGGLMGGDSGGSVGGIDMSTILKLQQVFSALNRNDKNTQLLYALKPHFSEERQTKVDQAISIMRLIAMLPAIKESNIFKGI